MEVNILNHPLITHKLTILRDKNTGTKEFRELVGEISEMLLYESMKDMPLEDKEIETPMAKMTGKVIDENKLAFIPILRAGTGMLDGLIKVIPNAKIGHIGMYRNEETLKPVKYYYKVPKDISNRIVYVLDPMLATGGSSIDAITMIKEDAKNPNLKIKFLYERIMRKY
jgi:uracil phosphoribosyltransferase